MLVATANVLRSITPAEAGAALDAVLDHRPDLVALQEWGPRRRAILRARPDYAWISPWYGENALLARRDRFGLVDARLRLVGGLGLADRDARDVPVLPPRTVLHARLHDRERDRAVSVVGYHLVPGVQRAGAYRDDRPRLVARHRLELRRLHAVVRHELDAGAEVWALGDANFDGLEIPGLVSAWAGRRDDPRGTLGPGSRRKIDDVFGPGPADDVVLLRSASDHAAVLARR
ncbi:hypothetical protein ABFT23_05860 [Nocardioides sp. C4-1]|uniref:hypothetical protein n=1 Tax=Nocardioides sp. C4-1 TaxID=3151851 RepID=UPI00326737AA